MDEFQARGSGWVLLNINFLEQALNKYVPIRGSSYIDLPQKIKNEKSCYQCKECR